MNKDKAKNPEANLPPANTMDIVQGSPSTHKKSDAPLNVEVSPLRDEVALPIPRPDTVPQRKSSIIFPSVHSKLSPQPHIHHSSHDTDLLSQP
ncbi:unnamed protein product [Gongylonema pulchrum]|uniref:PAM2 domain-containing protein n=1 Tax=Gongylonema pulchrum TaxID=637853 RepID=A0A183EU27_9BILA|nr:unnamed protein product [Gongylonema pulchrum]